MLPKSSKPDRAHTAAAATDDFDARYARLPLGAYRSTLEGRMLRANPALARLNGYADEAEQQAAVRDIATEWYVEPQQRAKFKRLLEREGRATAFISEVYRHKTRERIWVSENAHLVRDAEGLVMYYEGTVEDISAQVQAREALARSEENLRQIADHLPCVVYRLLEQVDGTTTLDYVSGSASALLGIEPEDFISGRVRLSALRLPDDEVRVQAELQAHAQARDGSHFRTQFRVQLPQRGLRWIEQSSRELGWRGDARVHVGVINDITVLKEAEALRIAHDRAAAAQQASAEFLSRVSHELRTPLNAVLGFAQLLQLEVPPESRHAPWVTQILQSGRHLLDLVDDVLDISSVQSGHLPMHTEPVPLGPVVHSVVAMLAGPAATGEVRLIDDVSPEGALSVLADERRLRQILANLLSNAVKYNRAGGWARIEACKQAGQVRVSISDNGPGIAPEMQGRLFQPFERLGAQRSTVQGTGLGLALSRQLAEAMGGTLTLRSEAGEGACFTLQLPAG